METTQRLNQHGSAPIARLVTYLGCECVYGYAEVDLLSRMAMKAAVATS